MQRYRRKRTTFLEKQIEATSSLVPSKSHVRCEGFHVKVGCKNSSFFQFSDHWLKESFLAVSFCFALFRSHCSPVTFRRRDSPIMHSSVPDEFKPVIFEAGRTIDHLGPIFSDVARCCQFALYARTHAIYIYIIPCDAAIDSPGKIVLKLKLTNFFEIHRV